MPENNEILSLKCRKKKNVNLEFYTQRKYLSKWEVKLKHFLQTDKSQNNFVSTPTLPKNCKESSSD